MSKPQTGHSTRPSIFRRNEVEGINFFEIGDRQWNNPKLREMLENIGPSAVVSDFEVAITFPHIGERVLLINARQLTVGKLTQQALLVAIEDITEQKKALQFLQSQEAWFRNTANNTPSMIWVAGKDKKRTFFNRTWLDFTGKKMETETGNGWMEDIHKDDIDRYLRTYRQAFEDRKPFQIEYRLRRHDGQFRWILGTGTPTYGTEGEFIGLIGSCVDIHDQRLSKQELEEIIAERTIQLEEKNVSLKKTNDELASFNYIASHDLQEPLRKIQMFTQKIISDEIDGALSGMGKEYFEKLQNSAHSMQKLIIDLLAYSRATMPENNFILTDLNATLEDAKEELQHLLDATKTEIVSESLPKLKVIPMQFKQLFVNLLSNSIKFAKPDVAPHVEIKSDIIEGSEVPDEKSDKKKKYHHIIFSDDGIGFSPEYKLQIFELFQRLHRKTEYPGTGLGLAIAKRVVDNHSGFITAESQDGEGAAFHVYLPVNGR